MKDDDDHDDYTLADKWAFYEPIVAPNLEECQNCGRLAEELVYLEGWDFRACPTCARECQLTDEAERLCPVLYGQLIRANGIREIETAFKAHPQSNCQHCRTRGKPMQTGEDRVDGSSATSIPGKVA